MVENVKEKFWTIGHAIYDKWGIKINDKEKGIPYGSGGTWWKGTNRENWDNFNSNKIFEKRKCVR